MEKATLTISLPRAMKDYILAKLQGGRFSTPSEYIRSLIRDEQDMAAQPIRPAVARRKLADGPDSSASQRVTRKK
jgi:Arc/MetJ-type ribon-helix-helix transcriptional regulator